MTQIDYILLPLKGKAVIRPIAFRPTPVGGSAFHGSSGKLSGASTPTNAVTPQPCSLNPLFRSQAHAVVPAKFH